MSGRDSSVVKKEVKQALKQTGARFQNETDVKAQCIAALSRCPHLRCTHARISIADRAMPALRLSGIVEMPFRDKRYNIPLAVYVPQDFPSRVPYLYVQPTGNLAIKPNHEHVDQRGVVYLPYLHSWNPRQSNILTAIMEVSRVFERDPFIYSRDPSAAARPVPAVQTQQQTGGTYNALVSQAVRPAANPQLQTPPPSYGTIPAPAAVQATVPPPRNLPPPPAQPQQTSTTTTSTAAASSSAKPAAASSGSAKEEPPERFLDMYFSFEIMNDPVVAMDGYTYEKSSIEEWLSSHDTSPATNAKLPSKMLIPNHHLRSEIREWQEKHGQK